MGNEIAVDLKMKTTTMAPTTTTKAPTTAAPTTTAATTPTTSTNYDYQPTTGYVYEPSSYEEGEYDPENSYDDDSLPADSKVRDNIRHKYNSMFCLHNHNVISTSLYPQLKQEIRRPLLRPFPPHL